MERLDKNVIHDICTNQIVVTLQACVKELVENSLDAGATRIDVKLRESGGELLEVVDDGRGVKCENHAALATRHATSKIREYDDLRNSLETFGFRGEALAGICAMGDMTITTKTSEDTSATLLVYDHFGRLTSSTPAAREVGTTVSVRELFKRLPVRHREFTRNCKAQVSATLRLIQSYSIANPEIRFFVVSEKSRGHGPGRVTLLATSGVALGWIAAAAAVLGDGVTSDVKPFNVETETGWKICGALSTPSGGRRSRDCQLFFVNKRPIDPPKRIVKLINDTYHQYNSRTWPVIILSLTASQNLVDVNVTPDKRTVFLHNEESLLIELQGALTNLWAPVDQASSLTLDSFGIRGASSSAVGATPAISFDSFAAGANNGGTSTVPSVAFETESQIVPLCTPVSTDATAARPEEAPTKRRRIDLDSDPNPSEVVGKPIATSAEVANPPTNLEDFASQFAKNDDSVEVFKPTPDKSLASRVVRTDSQGSSVKAGEEEDMLKDMQVVAVGMDLDITPAAENFQIVVQNSDNATPRNEAPLPLADEPALAIVPVSDNHDAIVPVLDMSSMEALPIADVAMSTKCGFSFHASPNMTDLERAIERRRAAAAKTASTSAAAAADAVQFPDLFSLASLGTEGNAGPSIDDVAKFDPSPEKSEARAFRFDKTTFTKMRVIGQFNLGFIIAALQTKNSDVDKTDAVAANYNETDGMQLFIIDQHASDEKFRFEGLNRESKIDRQPLINQHRLQLTPAQEAIAESNLEVFKMNGFDLNVDHNNPPGRRLKLATLPTCKGMVFGDKDVHDLIYTLEESEVQQVEPILPKPGSNTGLLDINGHRNLWSAGSIPRPKKVWQLLACRACRGAIMIGKALRIQEMEKILRNLSGLQQPWNCPHGRPTMRHLVDAGVAKRFASRGRALDKYLKTPG